MWEGGTDVSGTGMGGVFRDPTDQLFVWTYPFYRETQDKLISDLTPQGDITINDLELLALLDQIHIFMTRIQPLEHILTTVDNISVQSWPNMGSIRSATALIPVLGLQRFWQRCKCKCY